MQLQAGLGHTLSARIFSRTPVAAGVLEIDLEDVDEEAAFVVWHENGLETTLTATAVGDEAAGGTQALVTCSLVEDDFPDVETARAVVMVTIGDAVFYSNPFPLNVVRALLGASGNEVVELELAATG